MFEDFLTILAYVIGRFGVDKYHMPPHVNLLLRVFSTEFALYNSRSVHVNRVNKELHDILSCNNLVVHMTMLDINSRQVVQNNSRS